MTLYLKYRPQKIDELDLESVRVSLKKIIEAKSLPHGFLFAGPKGTGKTSAARILAKAINCEKNKDKLSEPCNKCAQCKAIEKGQSMDVIELDAASNRGIDDIRSLKESIALSPVNSRKKIYIIDEAHMLTIEAANAFLKTLEEPPSHVVFILATTEPEKLPATVRSRLILVPFKKANEAEINRQLTRIIKGEKLDVEDGVVSLIAKVSDGSFRDAAKILESLIVKNSIKFKEAKKYLLEVEEVNVEIFIKLLYQKDNLKILNLLQKMSDENVNPNRFIEALVEELRKALLSKEGVVNYTDYGFSKKEIISLIKLLISSSKDFSFSPIPYLPLEIAACKWCLKKKEPVIVKKKLKKTKKITPEPLVFNAFDEKLWFCFLSEIRGKNTTIEALLRATEPLSYNGSNLTIGVYYRFHKEQLEEQKNKSMLEKILEEVTGEKIKVSLKLTERKKPLPVKKEIPLTQGQDEDIIQAAKEIFGN